MEPLEHLLTSYLSRDRKEGEQLRLLEQLVSSQEQALELSRSLLRLMCIPFLL